MEQLMELGIEPGD
jgi:chromosome segregation ATPase